MELNKIIIHTILSLLILSACTPNDSENQNRTDQPNIIFILADDFGRELLSSYGGKSYQTPVLDQMSDQGLIFTDTYATPMCAPSRMMFLTGQYNFRNYSHWDEMNFNLKTIADYMQDAGYVTGMAGKWHRGGWNLDPKGPGKAGFMHYSSYDYNKFHQNAFWGIEIWENGELINLDKNESSSEYFNNYLSNFISENKYQPFFFYYAMNLVHRPFLPTPNNIKFNEISTQEIINRNQGDAKYFAENLHYLDELVGRVIKVLEDEGLSDNTIIIFTGDNGTDNVSEARELYSEFEDKFSSELIHQRVKGGKYFPTELGINVPLIVHAPGFIHDARVIEYPIDFTDMLPTFYELSGMSTKDLFTDGFSFASLIIDGKYNPRAWIYSYGNFENNSSKYKDPINNSDGFYHVISDGTWKFYSDDKLYNVRNDRLETFEIPTDFSEESTIARKKLMNELEKLRNSEPKLW